MKKKRKLAVNEKIFLILVILVVVLLGLNLVKAQGRLIPSGDTVVIKDGTVSLSSLSLEQKIGQMIVVHGSRYNQQAWQKMQLGGIHLFALESKETYRSIINSYQKDALIPFFVTVDLEGCQNPFANFAEFIPASEITSIQAAVEKGEVEGLFLQELGISINFAPVVDLDDVIWKCRAFPGHEENVSSLAAAYALSLEEHGVIATAKHYPGKTLVVRDPHKYLVAATIEPQDVFPYTYLFLHNASQAVMVSHIISSGEVDSAGIPSVASPEVIGEIKQQFSGLIVSDEINMLGLRDFYPTLDKLYIAVFLAGNDIVLNFNEDPNEIYRMITVVKEAVEAGVIPLENIDASVTKILQAKGFHVVR